MSRQFAKPNALQAGAGRFFGQVGEVGLPLVARSQGFGGEVEVGKRFADCFSSTQTTILASTGDYTNRFSLSDIQLIGGRKNPGEIWRKAIFFVELHANFLQSFLVVAFLSEKGG